jgi:protein-S-isoprenylcysteine O-methyltransferase Ste14
MHGEQETSVAPRTTGVVLHACILGIAAWILLAGGIETVGSWFNQQWLPGDLPRRIALFAFGCILFARLALTSFWLLKRRFDWGELVGVMFACVIYQIGFALLGAVEAAALGIVGMVGIGFFVLGSFLNTWSEIQRKRFKDDPANKGKLYTGGLFRYARHINYFGDTLWVTGWVMVTRNPWSAIVPVALAAGFIFFFIPSLSAHLRQKYGARYDEWAKTTKKFVPFVY